MICSSVNLGFSDAGLTTEDCLRNAVALVAAVSHYSRVRIGPTRLSQGR